jgi:hypothetical protein
LEENVAVTVAEPGTEKSAPLQVTADVVELPFWLTTAVAGSAEDPEPNGTLAGISISTLNLPRFSRSAKVQRSVQRKLRSPLAPNVSGSHTMGELPRSDGIHRSPM